MLWSERRIRHKQANESLSVKLTGDSELLQRFKRLFSLVEWTGRIGHSAHYGLFVDGDGADRLKVEGFDTKDYQDFPEGLSSADLVIASADKARPAKIEFKSKSVDPASDFMVKEVAGIHNWVLISSNSYQDRDGEIVTQKALEDDVLRADTDGDYGPLLWWHEKSIVLGQCTGNAMHERMLIEWGTFKSADIAERFKSAAATLGISIGFNHPVSQPDTDGLFHNIKRFERSVLPYSVASNPLTAIPLIHQEEPIMLKEKIDALKKVFGGDEALVNSVITLADTHQKAADEAGIRTKAASEVKCPHCGAMNVADAKTCTACGKPMDAKAADAAPPAEKKEYVGDMDPAALKALIGEAVTDQMAGQMATLKAELQTALDAQATTKEASEKAYAESVKALDAKLDGIAKSAKSALDGVAELKGELPRALGERLKGYRASEKGEEPPAELKSQEPAPDPMEKHWKAIQATAGIHAPTA